MKRRKPRRDQRTPWEVAREIHDDVQNAASDLGHSEHGYGLEGDIAADELYEDADFIKDMVADRVHVQYWQSGKDANFALEVLSELDQLFSHLPAGTFDSLKRDYGKESRGANTMRRRRRRFAKSPEDRMWELEEELEVLIADFDYTVHQVCPSLLRDEDTSESLEGFETFLDSVEGKLYELTKDFQKVKRNVMEQRQLINRLEQ